MKYYTNATDQCIGFDFYCDIAEKIVEGRKRKGWTQEQMAKECSISVSRIAAMESVKIRFSLEDIESIAKALNVSIDWLISADLDYGGKECMYLVWSKSCNNTKLYQKATSPQMALLKMCQRFKEIGVGFFSSCRDRGMVRLVGVPVTPEELKVTHPHKPDNDESLEVNEYERTVKHETY